MHFFYLLLSCDNEEEDSAWSQTLGLLHSWDCLAGLVVKTFTLRVADLGSIPVFGVGIFLGQVIPVI